MKLYFNDLNFNLDFTYKFSQVLLYTDEGIFYFKDSHLYKKNINDKTSIYQYKNYEIFVDDTNYNNDDEVYYYLPYNNIEIEEYYYEYIINKNIKLMKIKYFNEIEYYFDINVWNENNIKKIISFINKFNIKNNNYD